MPQLTTFSFDLSDPQARAFVRALLDGLDQKKPTGPIFTPIPVGTPAPPVVPPSPPVTFQELIRPPVRDEDATAKILAVLRQADGTMRAGNIAKPVVTAKPAQPETPAADTPPPPAPILPATMGKKQSPKGMALRVRMVEALKKYGKPMSPKKLAEELTADKVMITNYLNQYQGRLFLRNGKERNSGWLAM